MAEEAAVTAEVFGNTVQRIFDVGVAGLHRLLGRLDVIRGAKVVVAVAGMEGALPSMIGGLVQAPVIAGQPAWATEPASTACQLSLPCSIPAPRGSLS